MRIKYLTSQTDLIVKVISPDLKAADNADSKNARDDSHEKGQAAAEYRRVVYWK